MRDPELVARAQHAAHRLESAWERWRALQGIGETPAQPVVGYVGYALKEPWGQPRAVIGFSADEAERLADFLERGGADYGAIDRTVIDRGAQDRGGLDRAAREHRIADLSREAGPPPAPDQQVQLLSAPPPATPEVLAATGQLPGSQLGYSFLSGSNGILGVTRAGNGKGPCRRRLGSGRPGPGPSPDSLSSRRLKLECGPEMSRPVSRPGTLPWTGPRAGTCSGWFWPARR
jgi:hypothetical protein